VRRLAPALVLTLALTAAACGGDGGSVEGTPSASAAGAGVVVLMASTDLYAGAPQRVSVGLAAPDGRLVSFGEVGMAFASIGTAEAPTTPIPGPSATATFVPTYGTATQGGPPSFTQPSEGRGVYEAQDVVFDLPGYWQVTVTADVEGLGSQTGVGTFEVREEAAQPAPGQPALATENLTLDSKGVPESAIDSRYATDGEIPDPELHGWTIARALDEGRPALVVFSTPVYCTSRFCGPVTDMVQDLEKRYRDRAVFIHVEIWRDFDTQQLNAAAEDWLLRNNDLTEPWLYLIGADGTILDRWAALWSEDEVAAELDALPPMQG
jgi:hypothetical protein